MAPLFNILLIFFHRVPIVVVDEITLSEARKHDLSI
jgi:hypothetical protein